MIDRKLHASSPANLQRRRVLQGAAAVMVAGAAPAIAANTSAEAAHMLSGELVCNIADPVKTLVLRNPTNQSIVIEQLSNSALMFDGSVVDCNNAVVTKPVSIPANQEVNIRFSKRHPQALDHSVEDYQRVQSRVTRLSDGTRVIAFNLKVAGREATFS